MPVGLSHDYATLQKKDEDGFQLWITDLFPRTLGKAATGLIDVKIEQLEGQDIARVTARPSPVTVYLNPAKGERVDEVYVRFGNSTRKLTPKEAAEFRDQGAWVASYASQEPVLDAENREENSSEARFPNLDHGSGLPVSMSVATSSPALTEPLAQSRLSYSDLDIS